jgi:RNA polymerase sigma factor (TIGR02999 family)
MVPRSSVFDVCSDFVRWYEFRYVGVRRLSESDSYTKSRSKPTYLACRTGSHAPHPWPAESAESLGGIIGVMADVTTILSRIESGDSSAADQLLPLVYEELRKLAAAKLAQEKPGQTLQATALVHDAYLRLVGANDASWDSRGHFFAAAAEAIRRILVENARRKQAQKRGGNRNRIELSTADLTVQQDIDNVLILDETLEKLADSHPSVAELVRLRLFAGLSNDEAAPILGVSPRTARRNWSFARAWFVRELEEREEI